MNKRQLPDGVIELQGREYPTYPFVLNVAHERGLYRTETQLVQIPTAENGMVAIMKATAHFSEEKFGAPAAFEAYGDASPRNVNSRIAEAIIRMAETRAKGRAYRDGCNIGQTLAEELPQHDAQDMEEAARYVAPERTYPKARHEGEPDRFRQERAAQQAAVQAIMFPCSSPGCKTRLSTYAADLTQQQFGRYLCPVHAKQAAEHTAAPATAPPANGAGEVPAGQGPVCEQCGAKVTAARATITRRVFEGRILCVSCGEAEGKTKGRLAASPAV